MISIVEGYSPHSSNKQDEQSQEVYKSWRRS